MLAVAQNALLVSMVTSACLHDASVVWKNVCRVPTETPVTFHVEATNPNLSPKPFQGNPG